MADRFPLIVNAVSKKIEEIVAGDNLELTGNGIVISGDFGNGKYLTSDGSTVFWGSPGDVYLTAAQTVTNKLFQGCSFSGSVNTITNVPNSALTNPSITINGSSIQLGGSVITPDTNTTYSISAIDGITSAQKVIRLTAAGSGTGTDDIILAVTTPGSVPAGSKPLSLTLDRSGDTISLSGTVVDDNTVTSIIAQGGSAQTGTVTFQGTGCNVTLDDASKTVDIEVIDQDTITNLHVSGGSLVNGDVTLLATLPVQIVQGQDVNGDPTFTWSSTDTITKIKGGAAGQYKNGDILFTGGSTYGNTVVSQSPDGLTVYIDSPNDDTITKLAANGDALTDGNFRFTSSGATTITASTAAGVTTFDISSINSDTGATLTASSGVILDVADFQLKNAGNLSDANILKWDAVNLQLTSSIIEDDGSTVTIGGNLVVTGTNTTINTQTLTVKDPTIELRTGNSLVDGTGGIQINRTTDAAGTPVTYTSLQFYHSGGYWRVWDGSIGKPLVTTTDTQVLTNKTLSSPTFTGTPVLGTATATTINGLAISATTGGVLTIANTKTFTASNTITVKATDGASIDFGNGPAAGYRVAYTGDTLGAFAPTNSSQLQGIMTDATGVGGKLMFSASPVITTALQSTSGTFALLNTGPTTINAFGNAGTINIGKSSGNTNILGNIDVETNAVFGSSVGDIFRVNGTANFDASDIYIRGTDTYPLRIGRGEGSIFNNTAMGYRVLQSNTTGARCSSIGFESLLTNAGGDDNTAIGYRTLRTNSTGDGNVAVGMNALLSSNGDGNTAVGTQALYTSSGGSHNVCLGHFAGYNITGSGNVLIGPATTENDQSVTYQAISPSGSKQLVIGSGDTAWVRGVSSGDVTIPHSFRVNGDATIDGDLIVSGSTVAINSTTLTVDDKNIELAAVSSVVLVGDITTGTTITNVVTTAGLAVGMEITTSGTGGVTVNAGTYIVSIAGGTVEVNQSIITQGNQTYTQATFVADGPTELAAEGGGLIVKGDTDHSILYEGQGVDKYWTFTENLKIPTGKKIVVGVGNNLLISETELGSTITNAPGIEVVGTLQSLAISGNTVFGGRVTEDVSGNFATNISVANNTYTISASGTNTVVGTSPATPINTWDFTNVNLDVGQSVTITVILAANTAATYGDACNVDTISIANGVQWSGGSPPLASSNTDILTFVIIKDGAGVTRVFGQGNTDFS